MGNVRIFSKIKGNLNDLKKFVIKSIVDKLNSTMFSNVGNTERFIKDTILQSIRSQDEYSSLKSGELRNVLGVANSSDVDALLSELDNVAVKIKKPKTGGNSVNASIDISMVREGFSDLLSSPSASYTSENGVEVNWLEWLLTRGYDSVVVGYRYIPKTSPYSRTGQGIMVKGESAIFRVPLRFAGDLDNNWITRGIDAALPKIEQHMNQLVEKAL